MSLLKNKLLIVTSVVHLASTAVLMILSLLSLMGGTLGSSPDDMSISRLTQVLIWLLNPLAALIWTGYLSAAIKMNVAVGLLLFSLVIFGSIFFPYFFYRAILKIRKS